MQLSSRVNIEVILLIFSIRVGNGHREKRRDLPKEDFH